ncbi:rod shape determining protein RodA [Kytococcus aerolatus]|uniref:Rod shape determining protein RodA n=1 Tax=Kytococcus aerolatus TaxID=592308 RepID=A0A212U237_9MICO|nr:FtsW/RodA/SpoVE family cell cycle protein [Kytococcus aerolatus]SNC72327.1 rod shape determining protein RodA [Kytococcus aerolatus]
MSGPWPEPVPSSRPEHSRAAVGSVLEETPHAEVPHRYAAPEGARSPGSFPPEPRGAMHLLGHSDWPLLGASLALSLFGAAMVFSATNVDAGAATGVRHVLNMLVGIVLCVVLSRLDVYRLRPFTPLAVLLGWAGLVLVVLIGTTIAGAKSWISIGGFTIQPTEFMKVALCLGLAAALSHRLRPQVAAPGFWKVVLAWALALFTIGLVMLQPDLGSALVIGAMALGVVSLSGVNRWWILGTVLGAVTVATVAIRGGFLAEHQMARLTSFLNPEDDPLNTGFQMIQSRNAIGSGGVFGQGYLQGAQTQSGYLPVADSDFIFAVIGEELGLVGGAVTVGLIAFIVLRTLSIAQRTTDVFPRLVLVGVATWFGVQSFENIGMTMGTMPMTGVPLPFVSYGGTSMFACWMGIGLVNAVAIAQRKER